MKKPSSNKMPGRFVAGLFLVFFAVLAHAEEAGLRLQSGDEVVYARYPSHGDRLILWFASERGLSAKEANAARNLAARGVEVWQVDLVNALFLPQTRSSMDRFSGRDMVLLFDRARQAGFKQWAVYAVSRAAVPVLKGIGELDKAKDQPAPSILLMYPNIYQKAEALMGAEYLAFPGLDGVDIALLQPRRSAAAPWATDQLIALGAYGANVELHFLEGVREGFWSRDDMTPYESLEGNRLADLILNWAGWDK